MEGTGTWVQATKSPKSKKECFKMVNCFLSCSLNTSKIGIIPQKCVPLQPKLT